MPQNGIWPPARSVVGISALLPLLFCFGALLCGGCAGRGGERDFRHDDGGAVRFVLPDGVSASAREALKRVGDADYILVGEQHDNPADHKAQASLVEILAQRDGRPPVIGLEMLPRRYYDFQLTAFGKGRIDLVDLPEELNWKNTWGYDFALYRPVFEVARKYGLKLHGLNLPDAVRRSVGRKGLAGLSQAEKSELPARIIPPRPEQKERLLAAFRMHPAMGGRESIDRFFLIQSLWDSTMAEQAVEIRKSARLRMEKRPAAAGPPVVILAGTGHVEYGYGIASRIRLLDPGARIVLVMPFAGERPDPGAADLYYHSERRAHSPHGFTFTEDKDGLLIVNVAPGSRAETAGMRSGDRISRAGGAPANSSADLHKAAVRAKRQGDPLRFTLDRKGEAVQAVIPPVGT